MVIKMLNGAYSGVIKRSGDYQTAAGRGVVMNVGDLCLSIKVMCLSSTSAKGR